MRSIGIKIRFDVRRETKMQKSIHVFIRTNSQERKLFRQSLNIDSMGNWVDHREWMGGTSEYSIRINHFLHDLRQKLILKYLEIRSHENREPSGHEVITAYQETVGAKDKSLMTLIDEYTGSKGLSPATVTIYQDRIKRIIKKFLIMFDNGQPDISIYQIDLSMLNRFEIFLSTKYRKPNGAALGSATIAEYVSKFKALIRYAADQGYIKSHIFADHRLNTPTRDSSKMQKSYSRRISPDDLHKLETNCQADPTLERHRNLFIFQTWSGFAYADMQANSNIGTRIRLDLCQRDAIIYNRIKTGELGIVPLFPDLKALINRLQGNISPGDYGGYLAGLRKMLKAFNIQVTNNKPIGAHTGRHIFGERMLDKGFSMEAISRMMGHTSTRMTESLYARVDEVKVFSDYERIRVNG